MKILTREVESTKNKEIVIWCFSTSQGLKLLDENRIPMEEGTKLSYETAKILHNALKDFLKKHKYVLEIYNAFMIQFYKKYLEYGFCNKSFRKDEPLTS